MTESSPAKPNTPNKPTFDVVLHPNRSLGPKGFMIVMILVGLISFGAGMVFLLNGAWPVFGFLGLDVLIIYVALKLNFRDSSRYETIRLTKEALELRRTAPGRAEQAWTFEPYWARVTLDADDRLHLTSHGQDVEFAAFLIREEKESLRDALNNALRTQRMTYADGI